MSNKQQLIFDALSYDEWKRPLQIYFETKKLQFATILYFLPRLEHHGLIVSRKAELSEEILRERGGRPDREYKLTSSGLRVRLLKDGDGSTRQELASSLHIWSSGRTLYRTLFKAGKALAKLKHNVAWMFGRSLTL